MNSAHLLCSHQPAPVRQNAGAPMEGNVTTGTFDSAYSTAYAAAKVDHPNWSDAWLSARVLWELQAQYPAEVARLRGAIASEDLIAALDSDDAEARQAAFDALMEADQ